ncbi:MAG: hypothetical protein DHS20C06_02320 [Hyphobacterium sp.]|nr:MAG: hypothetical protein DHS20C06_02320 [Hyphobacterium sp.]
MRLENIFGAFAFLAVMMVPASAQANQASRNAVLTAFFEAFNAHDSEAMADWVSDDIRVIYLSADGSSSEVNGVESLAQSMQDYFTALPSARSEILSFMVDGDHIAVRESASWMTAGGEARNQTALAVYRIENGLIASVWYYPETRAAN